MNTRTRIVGVFLALVVLTVLRAGFVDLAHAELNGTVPISIEEDGVHPYGAQLWLTWSAVWTNNTGSTQRLVSDEGAPVPFDTGEIAPGETVSIRFDFGGRYAYHSTTNPLITGVIAVDQDSEDARIVVRKEVSAPGGAVLPAPFEVCIIGPTPTPERMCKQVTAGNFAIFDRLVPGEYIVTESDPGLEWNVVGSGVRLLVRRDQSVEHTIKNVLRVGSLEVRKKVSVPEGIEVDEDFAVCIEGPLDSLAGTGQDTALIPALSCQRVEGGATVRWDGLAPGKYRVTELDGGLKWKVEGSGVEVIVYADTTAHHTITNRLAVLRVIKDVQYRGYPPIPGQTFEVCIEGPSFPAGSTGPGRCHVFGPNDNPKEPDWNMTYEWIGLIPGSYRVIETDPGPMWNVVYEPADGSVSVVAGERATATVTNIDPPLNPEAVAGIVDGSTAGPRVQAPLPPNTGTGTMSRGGGRNDLLPLLLVTLAVTCTGSGIMCFALQRVRAGR